MKKQLLIYLALLCKIIVLSKKRGNTEVKYQSNNTLIFERNTVWTCFF